MSTAHRIPDGVRELAELVGDRRAWDRRLAALRRSGVPMNADQAAPPAPAPVDGRALLASVERVDGDLRSLREEHATKFRAARDAEVAVNAAIAANQQITPESDLFKQMDAAGKAAGELEDKINGLETVKAGLVARMAAQGLTPAAVGGDGSGDRDTYLAALQELRGALVGANGLMEPLKSAGQKLTESEHYAELVKSRALLASEYPGRITIGEALNRDELKAALLTGADPASAGAFVTPQRIGYYPLPLRPLTVLDLITVGQTDSDLIEYVKMLTLAIGAAAVPEAVSAAPIDGTTVTALQGGRKPESGMTFAIVQEAVSTIAHWIPATKRALSDAGQLRTIIDGSLRWGLSEVLEAQIVAGDGVGDNLLGILNQTGLNAIGAGTDSHADKIHRGITQNRLDGFASTGILMNPLDAEVIWLSRDGSGGSPGTGGYLFGAPNNPGPRTLWGLPVAESPAIPQGTAVVGNLQAAILWLREGTQVLASDSHADFFTRNLVAVLAEMRAGFGLPQPAALCEVNLAAA
jgi:HK97 family phage major capsid protein